MCEWGYETGRGKEALDRMNWAHAHYQIANDDFLYVLSTFIYEPVRWIDAVGWRPGITGIPSSYEAFAAWSRACEQKTFRFAQTNQRVGSATRDLFAAWFPRLFTPVVRYSLYAMLDPVMITAFGFPQPLPLTRQVLRGALRLRGLAVGWLPPLTSPHFFTDDRNRTHRQGYEISSLGPPKLLAAEKKRASHF